MLEVERKYFSNKVDFQKDVALKGPIAASGAAEFTGSVSFSGAVAFTGNLTTTAPAIANKLQGATITVGTEGTDTVAIGIQLIDGNIDALTARASCMAYLSDDANGDSIAATAPDGGVAIGTDGLAIPLVAGKCWQLTSEADGDIDLVVTESGTATWYLILVMPDGSLIASDAITLAA